MSAQSTAEEVQYTFTEKALHDIHTSKNVEQFCARFEMETKCHPTNLVDNILRPDQPRAIFVAGSIPMGMATSISDIDFIVFVDSQDALLPGATSKKNSDSALTFSNDGDPLSVGHFIHLINGIEVDINIVLASKIEAITQRLKLPGPELSDGEVLTIGRLKKAWLISKSDGFLDHWDDFLSDYSFEVLCATRFYWMSLKMLEKARKAASMRDFPVALYLARISAECVYWSYFASRGFCALGTKWLKFVTVFDFNGDDNAKHLFNGKIPLVFPQYQMDVAALEQHFETIVGFQRSGRATIEKDLRFKIAFAVCPQIYPV